MTFLYRAIALRLSGGRHEPLWYAARHRVHLQRTIAELSHVYVNDGRRGYLVGMTPAMRIRVLRPALVDIATAN